MKVFQLSLLCVLIFMKFDEIIKISSIFTSVSRLFMFVPVHDPCNEFQPGSLLYWLKSVQSIA